MAPEYILLIVAGGVFAFFLLLYALVAFERYKQNVRNAHRLAQEYGDKNLRKMEYDIAFFDEESYRLVSGAESDRQVTIEDLLNENHEDLSDSMLFAHVEEEGVEEITGTYNPEKVK